MSDSHKSATSSDIVFKAIETAAQAHAGQFRKGTRIPYLCHPLDAAKILARYGYDDEMVAAAVLHDVVEDSTMALADVANEFGSRIADIVGKLSNVTQASSWRLKKQRTIENLTAANHDALIVAASDKISNLRDIRNDLALVGENVWSRFWGSKEDVAWYYRKLARLFSIRLTADPDRELARELGMLVERVFTGNQGSDRPML